MVETDPKEHFHPLETPQSPEEIIARARWEDFTPQTGPLSGAIVHWGVDTDNPSLTDMYARMGLKIGEEEIAKTGFRSRSLYPTTTTMREAAAVEEVLGTQLILRACENYGIEPEQLAAIGLANSFPYHPTSGITSFTQQVAAWSGVKEEAVTLDAQLLCNGSLELLRQIALRQEELEGQYVAVGSVEGLGKVQSTDAKEVDPTNFQIFTNAGGVMVFEVGRDIVFTNKGEFNFGIDDPNRRGIVGSQFFPFPETMHPGDVRINETSIRQRIAHPENGAIYASMNPANTLKWVVATIKPMLIRILEEQYPDLDSRDSIPFIGHVPSQIIHEKLIGWATKEGFNLDAPVYVPDGNGSSATTMKQILRASAKGFFDEGREVFGFGYGLGWNASWLKMKVPQQNS